MKCCANVANANDQCPMKEDWSLEIGHWVLDTFTLAHFPEGPGGLAGRLAGAVGAKPPLRLSDCENQGTARCASAILPLVAAHGRGRNPIPAREGNA